MRWKLTSIKSFFNWLHYISMHTIFVIIFQSHKGERFIGVHVVLDSCCKDYTHMASTFHMWPTYECHDHATNVIGWLQGKVVHFLSCNPFFCKVACIYILLTWHKNNNFSNLWLDLNFQLEEKNIYKFFLQHI
jgi:hypothetical protein